MKRVRKQKIDTTEFMALYYKLGAEKGLYSPAANLSQKGESPMNRESKQQSANGSLSPEPDGPDALGKS